MKIEIAIKDSMCKRKKNLHKKIEKKVSNVKVIKYQPPRFLRDH